MQPPRVLFVHGLESNPHGSKVRTLRAQGFDVTAPDLEMALWSPRRRNSALRNILRSPEVWLLAIAGIAALAVAALGYLGAGIASAVLISFVGWRRWPAVFSSAFRQSFESSVDTVERTLMKSPPDILVGSSWGGAVTCELIVRGRWCGPTVLLAPAFQRVHTRMGTSDTQVMLQRFRQASASMPIVIFHDPTDNVVPIADSIELADGTTIDMRSVDGGGHRLGAVMERGEVKAAIDVLAQSTAR